MCCRAVRTWRQEAISSCQEASPRPSGRAFKEWLVAKKFGKRGKKKGAPEDPRNMFGPPMPRRGGPPASSTPLADFLDRGWPGVDDGYVVLPRSLAEAMGGVLDAVSVPGAGSGPKKSMRCTRIGMARRSVAAACMSHSPTS